MSAMDYSDKAPQQEDFEKNSADHLEQGSGSVNTADQDELAALEKSANLTGYVIYLSTVAGLAGFLFGCKSRFILSPHTNAVAFHRSAADHTI